MCVVHLLHTPSSLLSSSPLLLLSPVFSSPQIDLSHSRLHRSPRSVPLPFSSTITAHIMLVSMSND